MSRQRGLPLPSDTVSFVERDRGEAFVVILPRPPAPRMILAGARFAPPAGTKELAGFEHAPDGLFGAVGVETTIGFLSEGPDG